MVIWASTASLRFPLLAVDDSAAAAGLDGCCIFAGAGLGLWSVAFPASPALDSFYHLSKTRLGVVSVVLVRHGRRSSHGASWKRDGPEELGRIFFLTLWGRKGAEIRINGEAAAAGCFVSDYTGRLEALQMGPARYRGGRQKT